MGLDLMDSLFQFSKTPLLHSFHFYKLFEILLENNESTNIDC